MKLKDYYSSHPDIPKRDIHLLFEHVLNIPLSQIPLKEDFIPSKPQERQLTESLLRRANGEPIQRIIGEWEFWGLPFYLSEDTLVPRPDTETIIEAALKHFKAQDKEPERILDLGTGTGCILISLLHEWKNSHGIAVDVSKNALDTAMRNATRNNVDNRMETIQSNWLDNVYGKFDLILSNPPYIASNDIESLMPEVRDYDPILALDGGKDGLQAIHVILESLPKALKSDGIVFFEIGYDQCHNVMNLIENSGMEVTNVHRDLGGKERVIEFTNGDKSQKIISGA